MTITGRSPLSDNPVDPVLLNDEMLRDVNCMARRFMPSETDANELALKTIFRAKAELTPDQKGAALRFLLFKLMREAMIANVKRRAEG